MKRIIFTVMAVSLLLVGCNNRRTVDETVETERYTLKIQGNAIYGDFFSYSAMEFSFEGDTWEFCNTVPQMAYFLVSHYGLDSTTMYYIDMDKQVILPRYVYTLVDHDTTQPADYTQLLQAMIDRGILRTDTTYEPLQVLVVFDSARFVAHRTTEWLDEEPYTTNIASIVVQLQEHYRMPVSPAPDVDIWSMVDGFKIDDKDWQADSLWLDERGLRVIPDPEGRQMRIIEFNRAKGNI